VDITALREHLVDMNELILNALAQEEPIPGGLRITVTGKGRTLRAIQSMVPAHAVELAKTEDWQVEAAARDSGARLSMTSADPQQEARIRGLGFFGLSAPSGTPLGDRDGAAGARKLIDPESLACHQSSFSSLNLGDRI
jgi:hypothetical protein